MLFLFNNLRAREKGLVATPAWRAIKDSIDSELDAVIQYYRKSAFAVQSSHELSKILFGYAINTDLATDKFYRIADNDAMDLAQQLGYTTSRNQGRIFTNVFFARGSKEIIIADDEPFDPHELTKYWMYAQPIRVLRHEFDTIDYFPLTGKRASTELSVFYVNFPMLAVQYRAYRQWQKATLRNDEGRDSMYHFLYSYPLNNARRSSLSMCLMNRFMRLAQNEELNKNRYRHPFHIVDYDLKVNSFYKGLADAYRNKQTDMATMLLGIPLIEGSGLEFAKLPDILATRQVNWALYISRINILTFLVSRDPVGIKKLNPGELNRIKFILGTYVRDNTIRSALPADVFVKEKEKIELVLGQI